MNPMITCDMLKQHFIPALHCAAEKAVLLLVCLVAATLGCSGSSLVPRGRGASDAFPGRGEGDITLQFVGDIMLDGGPGHLVNHGRDPFEQVAAVLLSADAVVGNLECAITRKGSVQQKNYTFKGTRKALPLLKKYFAAVSLANNHAGDWGHEGFADELALLREQGIPWFGGGGNEREARRPLVLTVKGSRIAFLGYNDFPPREFAATADKPGTAWLIEQNIVEDIASARAGEKADWVILYLHWGRELEERPTPEQEALARRLIDAGADAVIGSHPHLTQTIEWYRGKPVVYSLGNFVFDYYPNDPAVWTSYILQLRLGKGREIFAVTIPIELDLAGLPHPVPQN